jgi:hypothetical protein
MIIFGLSDPLDESVLDESDEPDDEQQFFVILSLDKIFRRYVLSMVDIEKLRPIIQSITKQLLKDKTVNFFNLIQLACAVVEKYSATYHLGSSQKAKTATEILDLIIDTLENSGVISAELSNKLKSDCSEQHIEEIMLLIDTMIAIANDPNVLSLGKWKERAKTCWFGCCK